MKCDEVSTMRFLPRPQTMICGRYWLLSRSAVANRNFLLAAQLPCSIFRIRHINGETAKIIKLKYWKIGRENVSARECIGRAMQARGMHLEDASRGCMRTPRICLAEHSRQAMMEAQSVLVRFDRQPAAGNCLTSATSKRKMG